MVEQRSKYKGPIVIGTGLPRTGTTSLQVAFHALGFAPCSHFRGDFANDSFPWTLSRRWRAAMYAQDKRERQTILHQIFADQGFNSCTDYPSSLFVEDLVEMYPDAKFVHCERSSAQLWRESVNESIGQGIKWKFLLPTLLFPAVSFNLQPIFRAIQARTQRVFGVGLWASRDDVGLYHAHNAWVRRVVPKEKLLIFNPKDGYPVLCEFLGVPIPQDGQGNDLIYPHVNDRETMNKGFAKMLRVGWGMWAVLISGVSFALNRYGVIDFSQLLKYLK
ncbi:hypothetical protein F5B22DRAFT_647803 [Xylaria bambusicola]|uniref:uncharacterized protein n=1 Tax=Xylaria bambusicola TaxID=326684 RepID=UPI0020086886|nr:uncharacterized protein F5B22DRAFT_647803 [Xylaria bambusicola]KAI0513258.1 hypothetical protein F5B22DRAFT_647803 [Xylaria bambusicola]